MPATSAPPPRTEPVPAGAPVAATEPGAALHALLTELYPLPRSLTGEGVRQTLRLLQRLLPELRLHEVPSGTAVLDWTVPPEWRLREAYVANAAGERVIDAAGHPLHVVGYSQPVHSWLTLDELRPHLHSLPAQPTRIPYRTTYYQPAWGFCLSQQQLDALTEPLYEVCIAAELDPHGSLTYGELLLPGTEAEEVLISCHICHPGLANDNLSGLVVAAHLAHGLSRRPHRLSYRFVFGPGTIGPITWLSRQTPEALGRIRHGLVATLLGGPGAFTYKRTRLGGATIDRAVAYVLRQGGYRHELRDFVPYGYDERQYCAPGFDLPVGCLSRTPHGEFPEYHTSADDCAFVQPGQLAESLQLYEQVVQVLEGNARYLNRQPYGEPQLGRRGLYDGLRGQTNPREAEMALLWLLSYSDGQHDLLAIAERSGLPFPVLRRAADQLLAADLLGPLPEPPAA